MKRNFVKLVLIVSVFMFELISCGKTEVQISDNFIGNWQSTQVDSLFHYIVPKAPDSLFSCDYACNYLEIHEDGSFVMINLEDTTVGSWEQLTADSLSLISREVQGKVQSPNLLKIEYVDQYELVLSRSGGFFSAEWRACDTTMTVVKDIRYEAKVHYVRK